MVGLGVVQVLLGILDVGVDLRRIEFFDRDRLFGENGQPAARNVGEAAAHEQARLRWRLPSTVTMPGFSIAITGA